MKDVWDRIHTWLAAHAPGVLVGLRPGATEEQLRRAEEALGVTLPEDVRAAYRIHDGQGEDAPSLVGRWEWLPLGRVVDEWRAWKDLVDGGSFTGTHSDPGPGVRDDWYHPAWIPLTSNGGGDHHCVDLAPEPGGRVGQVIEMWHDDSVRRVLAPSFGDWLAAFADDLERGAYAVGEYGLEQVA